MESNNSLDEMVYNYCMSLCVWCLPDTKMKGSFVISAGKMSEEDYNKTMEALKEDETDK